jgi:hypothetical protein
MRVQNGSHRLTEFGIAVSPWDRKVLSDDGRFLAVIRGPVVSVHDIEAKRLVAAARLPQPAMPFREYQMLFVSSSLLRIYEEPRSFGKAQTCFIRAFELDLATRRLTQTGVLQRESRGLFVTANDDASRLIVQQWQGPETPMTALVVDGRTLRTIQSIEVNSRPYLGAAFLTNDRIAVIERAGDRHRLVVFADNGQRVSTTDLAMRGFIIGQAAGETLVLGGSRQVKSGEFGHSAFVVDLQNGQIVRREERYMPIRPEWSSLSTDPREPPFAAEKVWLLRDKKSLWRWNPSTGEKTLLF